MSVSYFVRYEGQADDLAAFLAHYREHHAPILAAMPGIQRIVLHTPVAWSDPFPVKPDRFVLLAQMEFGSRTTWTWRSEICGTRRGAGRFPELPAVPADRSSTRRRLSEEVFAK